MDTRDPDEITNLLNRADAVPGPADELWERIYPELRRRAQSLFRGERSEHTLSATAVVNEVFLRLATSGAREWQDRSHFYAAASGIMRHVLADHARARLASKRGAGAFKESLDESIFPSLAGDEEGYQIAKEALDRLADENERAALVVALRAFGGLTVEEVADELEISPRTVKSDWVTARVRIKNILAVTLS